MKHNQIGDIAADYLAKINTPVDELYHYTSIEAFTNIFQSQSFWLTEHSYLSDYSEVTHGLQILYELLNGYQNNKFIDYINSKEQQIKLGIVSKFHYHTFVLSLTEEPNSKSQWNEYGDSYTGCCIGLDQRKLCNIISAYKYPIRFRSDNIDINYDEQALFSKAIYKQKEKHDLLKAIVDKSISIALDNDGDNILVFQSVFVDMFFTILKLLPLFKNEDFMEEKEHRLVIQLPITIQPDIGNDPKTVSHRVIRKKVVPYFSYVVSDFNKAVSSLSVGPKYNDVKYEFTLKEFCNRQGIDNISIRKSTLSIH